MLIYFFIFSFSLVLYYFGKKQNNKYLKLLSLIILVLFSGLRYLVGQDFKSYWWIYQSISHSLMEPGYLIICKGLTFLGFGAQIHFIVFAFLTLLFIINALKYYDNRHIVLCLFLYLFAGFYIDSLNIVRQSLAIAIFFWSAKYIILRNFKKFFACIIGAMCFHSSAFLLIPFYFILNKNISKPLCVFILIGSIFISYTGVINKILGWLPIYTKYLESGNTFNVNSNLGAGFISKYLIGLILLLFKNKLAKYSPYINLSINSYLIYLIIMGLLQDYLVFLRFSYYFQIFFIIAIPALISIFKNNGSKIIVKSLVISYCCLTLIIQTNDKQSQLIPYQINYNLYQINLEK